MGKNNNKKIRKCFELFESKYASQNLRNALKELFKWKCLSLNAYIRKIKLYIKFNFLYYEARNHLIQIFYKQRHWGQFIFCKNFLT